MISSEVEPSIEKTFNDCDWILSLCFSPDQTKICSVSYDALVSIWDIGIGRKNSEYHGHKSRINFVNWSPKGNLIASGSEDCTVGLWNPENTDGNSIFLEGHTDQLRSVIFNSDGNTLISGSSDAMIKIWDVERKKDVSTINSKSHHVYSLAISCDDRTFVSGNRHPHCVKLWDFRIEKCVHTFTDHLGSVYSVKYHPNTYFIASGSEDRTIKVFDLRTLKVLHDYREHSDFIKSIDIHPKEDGNYLISGSYDGNINIYDLRENNNNPILLREHSAWVRSVQFSPVDGKFFASGGYDQTIILWKSNLEEKKSTEKLDAQDRRKYIFESVCSEDGEFGDRFVLEIGIRPCFFDEGVRCSFNLSKIFLL